MWIVFPSTPKSISGRCHQLHLLEVKKLFSCFAPSFPTLISGRMALCAWLDALWLQAQPSALSSYQSNIMYCCVTWLLAALQAQRLAWIKHDLLVDCCILRLTPCSSGHGVGLQAGCLSDSASKSLLTTQWPGLERII